MAFEGDLSNLSLGDVLQTIGMSRQVGTFVIRGEEERRLACGPQGVALLSTRSSLGLRIGTVLVGTGKVSKDHLDQALKIQRRRREAPVGEILVEIGACGEDDMRSARRYLAAEEIFDLFLWREGKFEFIAGEPELSGPFSDLWFDVGSLAMEAARRIDELPRAMQAVPAGEVYVRADGPNPREADLEKSHDLATLHGLADGTRTVLDIYDAFYRGRFDTWKGMESLLEAKLIRVADFPQVIEAAKQAHNLREYARAARLFQRAAAHDPNDDSLRQAVADALRDSGDKKRASTELVALGNSRLAAGKGLPAVDSFRQAILLDANNADAQEGLMRALADAGQIDDCLEAARSAAGLRISVGDYEGACRVAQAGLATRAGDPQLLLCLANAHQGLGRSADALALLDDVAQIHESSQGSDRKLLDVYRRILQIDPQRKDCLRRIDEIQAFERTKRRRLMQRVAVAAGVLVLAMAAVPFLRGPSVEARFDEARALIEAKDAEGAQAVLDALSESDLTEEQATKRVELTTELEVILHPPESASVRKKLDGEIDDIYQAAAKSVEEEHLADGFDKLLVGLDLLEGPDARKLKESDAESFERLRREAEREIQNAIGNAATVSQRVASRVTSVRDRFIDDVWKHEDLDLLHELVAQSSAVLELTKAETWASVPELLQLLVARTHAPSDATDKKTLEAVATITEAYQQVAEYHDRGLSRARRKELKEGYKSAYANGTQLERDGRLEDALGHYEKFLAQCEELKTAQPEALYRPIIVELFGPEMQLDQLIRARRIRLATIVRDAEEAQKAEASDDFETAFRIRKRLVKDNGDLDLSRRFQMPLRVETAPPGAELFLLDGSPSGRALGRTPVATEYPIAGGVKYELRLAGYKSCEIVREGALEDTSGVARLDMPKLATWSSKSAGMTEAAPTPAPGSILVASRSGVLRRIDAKTGAEAARFEPGSLDGFAGAAVVQGDRVIVVALDGKGYILELEHLTKLSAFDTGAVRGAPLVTRSGVFVADEAGDARLIDYDGAVVWQKKIGKVKTDPAAAGDRALVVTADAEMVLIDIATGAIAKRHQLRPDALWGPPSVRGDRVFLANELGEVVCFDSGTLHEEWSHRVEGPVRGRVCATDLRLVACTGNGAVIVLDAETGGVLSRTTVAGKIEDGACDLPDGGFVVVTRKGNATRFDSKAQIVWKYDAGEEVSAPPRLVQGLVVLVTRKGTVVGLTP